MCFLAHRSNFSRQFHSGRGDALLRVSPWVCCGGGAGGVGEGGGSVRYWREVQYTAPIKTPLPAFMSIKTTRVRERQSCEILDGQGARGGGVTVAAEGSVALVIESVTSLLDIPFGSNYDVKLRLILRQVAGVAGDQRGQGGCVTVVTVLAGVNFTKSCIFERKIREDSMQQLVKTYEEWANKASEAMQSKARAV